MSRRRGTELKRELETILQEARAAQPRRRDSVDGHAASGCRTFFQHGSAFRDRGLRVATRVHSAAVVRSCFEFCIDTLNDMKRQGVIVSRSDYVRSASVSIVRDAVRGTTHGTVRLLGPNPHTDPNDVQYAVVSDRTPSLGLPLHDLRRGTLSHIPVYVTMDVMRLDRWEAWDHDPTLVPTTRLTRHEHPRLAAALDEATLAPNGVLHLSDTSSVEIPVFGVRSWMEKGGHKWVMQMDPSYAHAVAIVFTPHNHAVVVDSNPARPEYADHVLRQWVESLGFQYRVARFPEMNQADTDDVKSVLSQLGVDTPMTIKGYCASLSLSYLIDVVCTHKYDDGHLHRFFSDIVPSDADDLAIKACIVIYARAITNDCLKVCLRRLRAGVVSVPHKWPSSVPIQTDHATRTVTWREVLSAVATVRRSS